jgi:hypothetical protein
MRHGKLTKIMALGLGVGAAVTLAVAGTGNANAVLISPGPGNPPYGGPTTFSYEPIGFNVQADAYAFSATGLLKINPTIRSTCNANSKDAKYGLAVLLAPLITVSTPNTGCTYGTGFKTATTPAAASGVGNNNTKIASVNILNGAIKVNAIDSECGVSPNGTGFAGSTIGYLNGVAIGNGYGRLILPDLLQVEYNDSEYNPVTGELVNYALKVTVGKTLVIAGHTYTVGQELIVGECSVSPTR